MAKEMIIEKTVSINRNINEVFNYLKQTKNQDNFSEWNMKDPGMKKEYAGTDGTKGFIYSWDSKDKSVGAGSQEITNITEPNKIDYLLKFKRPMQNSATSGFALDETGENNTSVTWKFQSTSKFPMSLFASFLKKILGKQMEQSLQNLKAVLEK